MTIDTPTVDCHCPKCRRYHVAGFTSYIQAPIDSVSWNGGAKTTHRDACDEVGSVDRIYCPNCRTKMATTAVIARSDINVSTPAEILINMGPMEEETVPDKIWMSWQRSRKAWQLPAKAMWLDAKPAYEDDHEHAHAIDDPKDFRTVKGSCGCGASTYSIQYHAPSELQHCYCRLCRQFSGSAFQTWVPVANECFAWTCPEPELVRTTQHGARHMCGTCGGVLTIVYDESPETIWPAAGGFLDETLPLTTEQMGQHLYRVAHICCLWKQNWYKLPTDGNERIDYAC